MFFLADHPKGLSRLRSKDRWFCWMKLFSEVLYKVVLFCDLAKNLKNLKKHMNSFRRNFSGNSHSTTRIENTVDKPNIFEMVCGWVTDLLRLTTFLTSSILRILRYPEKLSVEYTCGTQVWSAGKRLIVEQQKLPERKVTSK